MAANIDIITCAIVAVNVRGKKRDLSHQIGVGGVDTRVDYGNGDPVAGGAFGVS